MVDKLSAVICFFLLGLAGLTCIHLSFRDTKQAWVNDTLIFFCQCIVLRPDIVLPEFVSIGRVVSHTKRTYISSSQSVQLDAISSRHPMTDTYQEVGTRKQWKMQTTCTTSLWIDVLCRSLLIGGVMRFLIFSYKQCVVLGWDVLWIYSLRRIHSKPSCLDSVPGESYSWPIATGTLKDWSPHSGFGSHGYRGSKIPQNKQIFTVDSPTVIKLLNHQLITSPTWSSELWNDTFHSPFEGTEIFISTGEVLQQVATFAVIHPDTPGLGEAWVSGCRWPQMALVFFLEERMTFGEYYMMKCYGCSSLNCCIQLTEISVRWFRNHPFV